MSRTAGGHAGGAGTPRSPAVRLATGAGLALLLLVALALLAEGGLRVASRVTTGTWPETRLARFQREIETAVELYRGHPFLNTAPAPGAEVEAFGKRASFNALGYRSPERPLDKPPGLLRVVCAGGSTTFDLLAPADRETWPWRLEDDLRRRGLDAEVWNAGFPGWTSVENLISLSLREIDLEPDLVLFYQGINDLQPASHRALDRQYVAGHAHQSRRALGLELRPPGLLARSLVAERLRDAVRGPSDPWSRLRMGPGSGERHDRLAPGAEEVFGRNVRSFVAVAAAGGARTALVTQAVRVREAQRAADLAYLAEWFPGLEPEAAAGELERLNGVLRRIAAEDGLPLFDVAAAVDWSDEDFADPMHLSPAGTAKLLGLLSPRVAAELRAGAAASEVDRSARAGAGPEGSG